jgi:hypothetical protein
MTDRLTPDPDPEDELTSAGDDLRDELPEELDVTGFVGPYQFPDNSRRRVPGLIYLVTAAGCLALWLAYHGGDSVLVNEGFLLAAVVLTLVGIYCITSGWRMAIDEKQALVLATRAVAFPVGHASAQLGWRGLRSRPTWRILCYSAEEPPLQRGFVLIDAVDETIVDAIIEDNPEDWAGLPA